MELCILEDIYTTFRKPDFILIYFHSYCLNMKIYVFGNKTRKACTLISRATWCYLIIIWLKNLLRIWWALAKMFSTYYFGLTLKAREWYSAKLTLLHGVTGEDSYHVVSCQRLNDAKWWSSLHRYKQSYLANMSITGCSSVRTWPRYQAWAS